MAQPLLSQLASLAIQVGNMQKNILPWPAWQTITLTHEPSVIQGSPGGLLT